MWCRGHVGVRVWCVPSWNCVCARHSKEVPCIFQALYAAAPQKLLLSRIARFTLGIRKASPRPAATTLL